MTIIENHQKAAMHLEEAAKHHHEALKQQSIGNHHMAYQSTIKAYGHCVLASEAQKENLKEYETIQAVSN